MSNEVVEWAKHNPALAGVGVFIVGAILLYSLKSGGSGADMGGGADGAYYQAQAAQAAGNNAVSIAQIQANAMTAQLTTAADASVKNTAKVADTGLAVVNANNSTALAINSNNNAATVAGYPYAAQVAITNDLSQVAALPGTTQTHTSGGGLFSSKKTTTTYVPNPSAVAATDILTNMFSSNPSNDFITQH